MWRCLNNLFGYCAGEPQSKSKEESRWEKDLGGKPQAYLCSIPHCERDPETCGLYLTFTEHYLSIFEKGSTTNES